MSAKAEGIRPISISLQWILSDVDPHQVAARALCDRLGWAGELVGGTLPDGVSRVWVFVENRPSGGTGVASKAEVIKVGQAK